MQTAAAIPRPEDRRLTRKMSRFFSKEGSDAGSEAVKEDTDFLKRLPVNVQGAQVWQLFRLFDKFSDEVL